ncbi:MAG: hypothetical protein R3Y63_10720 [Eubacteriales bacterium]
MSKKSFFQHKIVGVVLGSTLALGLGSFALATGGSSSDPLVTLSYLQQTILPSLSKESKAQAELAAAEAEANIDKAIASLRTELESSSQSNQFLLVSLSEGEEIILDVGTQVVLRIGTATVTAASTPALVNLTQGTSIATGTSLATNHLYLATISDRTLTATANTVMLMISGGYVKK